MAKKSAKEPSTSKNDKKPQKASGSGSAKKSKSSKKFSTPMNIITLFIAIMEIVSIVLLEMQFHAICVQTMELGPQVYALLMVTYTFASPDLFMFCLMFVNDKIFFRPFSVMFHLLAFVLIFLTSLALLATLTFCGDKSQYFFLVAGVLCLLVSFMHLVCMIILLIELPKDTFPCLRKCILCKCKEQPDD